MNKWVLISCILLILIGGAVSRLKYEVVFLRKNLKVLQIENENYKNDIKVLAAEWSYLNTPNRLEKLADKYLPTMKPLNSKQIIKYDKIIASGLKQNNSNHDTDFNSLLDKVIFGRGNLE